MTGNTQAQTQYRCAMLFIVKMQTMCLYRTRNLYGAIALTQVEYLFFVGLWSKKGEELIREK